MSLFHPERPENSGPAQETPLKDGERNSASVTMPGSGGKYVGDYVWEEHTDETGRRRTAVRYVGSWYCVKTAPGRAKGLLFAALALGLAAAAALIASLMISHSSSRSGWVGVSQAAALIPLLTLILGLVRLPYALRPMERKRYYESIIRTDRSALGILILSAVTVAGELVFRSRGGELLYPRGDALFLWLFAGAAIACGAILFLLGRIEIEERPNEYKEKYYR